MVFLENDTFLTELTRLFLKSKAKGTGSVYVTMKRYDGQTKPEKNPKSPAPKKGSAAAKAAASKKGSTQQEPAQSGCLVRARLQTKKISTVVPADAVNRFQLSYCSVLRANMDSLKKVKKSKSKAKSTS